MSVENLIVKHADWIYKKARAYYKNNHEDADDLAGETILRCLCHADKYDCKKDFLPWVSIIMLNIYRMSYNRSKRVPFCELRECIPIIGNERTESVAIVNEIQSIVEDLKGVSNSIEAVLLYAIGYNYAEIAGILNISVGTVKSRIYSGRKIIKEKMGR